MGRRHRGPGDVLTSGDSSPFTCSFLGSRVARRVPHPPGSFLLPSVRVLCSSPLNQEALGSAIECDHLNSSPPLYGGVRAAQGVAEFQPANVNSGTCSVTGGAQRPGTPWTRSLCPWPAPPLWCGEHRAEGPDFCFLLSFLHAEGPKQECFQLLLSSLCSYSMFFLEAL